MATLPKFLKIKKGTTGFDISSKKKRTPEYRFNCDCHVRVVGSETKGCGEFEHLRYLVEVDEKTLSIRASLIQ